MTTMTPEPMTPELLLSMPLLQLLELAKLGQRSKERPKVVYLSGPMRGYAELNFPAFFRAEADLRALGYEVLNPARMDESDKAAGKTDVGVKYWIPRDVAAVLQADGIALMHDWRLSVGAAAEASVAAWAGKWAIFQGGSDKWSSPAALLLKPVELA